MLFNKIMKSISYLEDKALYFLNSVILVLVIIQVVNRYLIGLSMPWTDEAARFLFIWLIYMGASYGVRENSHIGIDSVVNRLSPKARKIVDFLMYCACMVFVLIMLIVGGHVLLNLVQTGQMGTSLRIPMYWPFLAIPLGGLLMLLHYLEKMISLLKSNSKVQEE